ncbi:hypothetical protein JG688_00016749, partial [Phytophthora aleatoria]
MGALFGSSLLATFLFIFRFRNARYAAFSTHVDNAREYMRSQNIPRSVRRQVIAYFSYAWNTHHSLDSEEALHLMPRHLQSKVVSTLKASRIKQVCFLAKENVEFINLLAAALVRRVYSPADPIIEPKFNAQMFFVIRETFEEKAVAKTFCELYVLAKSKFDEAMTDFYRENEVEVRAGMAETLEKYTIQLRKTKKLLGARNRAASSRRAGNPNSITATNSSHSRRRGVDWRLPGSTFRIRWDAVRLLSIIVSSKAHLVISLLLGVTFMLHVVGCVWFEMAWISEIAAVEHADKSVLEGLSRPDCLQHSTLYGNCSWVTFDCYAHIGDSFPAENPDSMYQASFAYMRSVYWAIVTLTAVGYGDIVAYSTAESFFAAFWVFVGGIINFGVVGAMSSTISNAMAPHHHHMEKLNTLNSILERMDISENLSAEIRRFYHHAFTGRKQAYESQLLSHLPDQLCYEISSLLHSESVKSVALFDSASIEFLKEVTGKFRHRIYQNGDSICLEATLTAASLVHASVMTREQFDVIQRKFDDDLKDMKEEAETLWVEQQKNMRLIVRNFERLKLQPHMMSTSTLFYQGDATTTTGVGAGKESKAVRDVNATREVLSGLWKTIIMCCNVYNTIFVIVRICFHSHLHYSSGTNTAVWVADLCCDICF